MSPSCREACLQSGEPLAGSAASVRTFVALSWPKRLWHFDKAAQSQGLPPALAELERDAKAGGQPVAVRVFQRGAGTPTDRVELLCYRRGAPSFRAPEVPLSELVATVESILDGADPAAATEPLGAELLVCTDGQHDDCCGRLGRPVYRALVDEIERRGSSLRAAECSHLGGHRFAANLLALPAGDLYGRLEPGDAGALLAALEKDRPLRYRYRGRLGASEAAQAADGFLAARLPEGAQWELGGYEQAAETGTSGVAATVRDAAGSRQVRVRCERRGFEGPSSCGAAGETRSRWIAVELEEVRS